MAILGVSLPHGDEVSVEHIEKEMDKIDSLIAHRPISSLIDSPPVTDTKVHPLPPKKINEYSDPHYFPLKAKLTMLALHSCLVGFFYDSRDLGRLVTAILVSPP